MLKKQIELAFSDRSELIEIWTMLPEQCRQHVVEGYARAIGAAAKAHAQARTQQKEVEDEHINES